MNKTKCYIVQTFYYFKLKRHLLSTQLMRLSNMNTTGVS